MLRELGVDQKIEKDRKFAKLENLSRYVV